MGGLLASAATLLAAAIGVSCGDSVYPVRNSATSPVASIRLVPSSASVPVGDSLQLAATALDATGGPLPERPVVWASMDSARASVSAAGVVTALNAGGPVTVSATVDGVTATSAITAEAIPGPDLAPGNPGVGYVQGNATSVATRTVSLSLPAATSAGDLILVGFDFGTTTFSSIGDNQGNAFSQVGSEVVTPGGAKTRLYYAGNIRGGTETVTVTLSGSSPYLEAYVTEYRGADPTSPLDGSAQHTGSAGSASSGNITTTASADLIAAYCVGDNSCSVGSGFTARSTYNSNLVEDKTVAAAGTYAATASASGGWAMVAVALKPAPVPVASVTVAPNPASVVVGGTVPLTATTKDASGNVLTGRVITWASSNTALATVNGSGVVTGVAAGGPVTITATSEGQSGTSAVTVSAVSVASVVVSPSTASVSVGYTVPLTATTKDASGNVLTGRTVTWTTSNAAIATVSATGLVTGVAAGGPVTVTATSEGQSGTAAVTVVSATALGLLQVSSVNPRYFTDGTGRAVYLTGSHYWTNLQDAGLTSPPPVFNWTNYLNYLVQHHHNFTRMWAWENVKWQTDTKLPYYYDPLPFARVGPDTAPDGLPKYDLTQFNQAYFDRLRQRVIDAGQRGIYVQIMLFDGWSIEDKGEGLGNPWNGHPMNRAWNVNGIDGDPNNTGFGLLTQTLQIPAITAIQEAYVRKVIDAVNDQNNVLYEISNESRGGSAEVAWEYHMIQVIRQYEAGLAKQHPVGMTALYPNGNDADLFASAADFISPAGTVGTSDVPAATGAKVLLYDTDHLCGLCGDETWVWKALTRGVNPTFMDQYDGSYVVQGGNPNDPRWEPLRLNLGYALTYANRMNLVAMTPHGELASTGYCLANPVAQGGEWLVYLPSGGSVTVNLAAAVGSLTVEWFSPSTGQTTAGGSTTGGASRTFTAPGGGDAVLYIH